MASRLFLVVVRQLCAIERQLVVVQLDVVRLRFLVHAGFTVVQPALELGVLGLQLCQLLAVMLILHLLVKRKKRKRR